MSNVTNGRTPESKVEPVAVSSEGEQQACSGAAFSQSQSSSQTSSSLGMCLIEILLY